MKLFDRATYWSTATGIRIIRIILPLVSDNTVARLLRFAEGRAPLFTSDLELPASIAEVAEVFELGPPYTSTVRKILASMDKDADLALSALTCLRKPSPYGAD